MLIRACHSVTFMFLACFCQQGLSGSVHDSASASIFATGLLLLKSWQPEIVNHALTSPLAHGNGPSKGKPNSSSASSSGASKGHTTKTSGATGSAGSTGTGSHSGASGGDDGRDDPPRKKPIPDSPKALYLGQPEEFEGVIIELVSAEPLVFRVRVSKRRIMFQNKSYSNTPWIQLKSGSGSAYLSFHTTRPARQQKDCGVYPLVRLDSQPVSSMSVNGRLSFAGIGVPFTVTFPNPRDPLNSPTESIGFTHHLDALPGNPSDLSVTLTPVVPQTLGIHTQPLRFHFHSECKDPAFLSYCPVFNSMFLKVHKHTEHEGKEQDDQATPGCCNTCRQLTPVQGYGQWLSEWSKAAAADEILIFDVEVKFESEDSSERAI